MIKIKRAYEKPAREDGKRILVDRLWPRGISKEELKVDEWLKDIAPSHELRKWFAHNIARWGSFDAKYMKELVKKKQLLEGLKRESRRKTVTLVYAAKSAVYNNAVVLKKAIEQLK